MTKLLYPLGLASEEMEQLPIPGYDDATRYKIDFTRVAIEAYVREMKRCVRRGAFVVLDEDPEGRRSSRKKNTDFMRIYGLYKKEDQKQFLLSLDVDEFCHAVRTNDGRLLHVFCADRTLYRIASGYELVRLYVKHDLVPGKDGFDVVISLHELELPIVRLFGE